KQISEYQKHIDVRHDNLIRGCISMLRAYAYFAETPEESAAYLRIAEELFPLGMDSTTQSYEEEAGAAEMIEQKLTATIQTALEGIPLQNKKTLLTQVQEIIERARILGTMEDKKAEAKKAFQAEDPKLSEARIFWVRTVNAFLSTLAV